MNWSELNWSILDRLRDGFLGNNLTGGAYWGSHEDLANYDFTYGERIGWKWDHVLGELARRSWVPPRGTTLDWGCGSGIAHRRVIQTWPTLASSDAAIRVWDHSVFARTYSIDRLQSTHPEADVTHWNGQSPASLLLISHVLNELDKPGKAALAAQIDQAQAVIWLEPGTSTVASELVEWRERLLPDFRAIYPCPHQETCGLLKPENARHWCHHFATPPSWIFADSDWVRFGKRAGIDLRSLPYSALVLERADLPETAPQSKDAGRVIGRPTLHKPYARALGCDVSGVQTLTVSKRVAPQLVKKWDRPKAPRYFEWRHEAAQVSGIKAKFPDES